MSRALIIGPGGLRGAYGGGVVATLYRALGQGYFDRIYGCSAGAYTGSYATSGQIDRIESFWRDCVHSGLLINVSRVIRNKRPVLDLFYLNDVLRSQKYRLSIKDMLASPIAFEIVATNRDTGQPHYFKPNSAEDFFLQIRASAAVPVVHPRVRIEGEAYMDGALSDPIPLEKALADGCDEIVIVSDRPIEEMGRLASTFLRIYSGHSAHGSVQRFEERLKRAIHLADVMDKRIHVITPSPTRSYSWQFDRKLTTMNQLVDHGIYDATIFLDSYKK